MPDYKCLDSSDKLSTFARELEKWSPDIIYSRGPARMYLRPFDAEKCKRECDSSEILETAQQVRGICKALAPVLRDLIVNIPAVGRLNEGVVETLQEGFQYLVNLEEFVSINELPMMVPDKIHNQNPNVWARWPKLRRVALNCLDLTGTDSFDHCIRDLANLLQLEVVVLTDSDYDDSTFRWFKHYLQQQVHSQKLSLIFVNSDYWGRWKHVKGLDEVLEVTEVEVNTDEDSSKIERISLDGTLWDIRVAS